MSKVYAPNYTQVPNVVIDDLAAKLSDSAFKIYVVLIRKTKGWDQKRDAIAISQFMELTGKSKPTVIKAIDELINLGLIKKTRFTKHGNEYELNLSFSHDGVFLKFRGKKSLLVKNFNIKGKEFLLLKVKNFDTQKKLSKETIKDTNINKGEVKKFDPVDCELPSNVEKKDWIDFVEMRKSIKKPLSELAAKKILKKLDGFGIHAKQALENSIVSSWSDVYMPKQDKHFSQPQNNRMQELQQLSEQWELENANYTPY
ncbi:phage replication protein O [Thermovibrio guaymasensis]|uniref:Phage replication protein O n=1 Tax=Thermovibrio guaymasensis TaxID=240167 RepID=A0A420W5J9_9BACT|nr:replication protein [Thermovibrio guaymasensis]RKQ59908.1 phage replication protein O [Thermovibrio guaymasensis]